MTLVLPCICWPARTMSPPKAAPMLWWPRHTPRMGRRPAKCWMAATEMPASAGEQGPGEITRRSIFSRSTRAIRSEEHTSELQSQSNLVCRLLLEKKKHTSELQSQSNLVCRLLLEKKKREHRLHTNCRHDQTYTCV